MKTYNAQTLKLWALFEKKTRTRLKDCFIDDNDLLTFVVPEIMLGKAIGKKASNVKNLEGLLKRKIKIVGFNSNPDKFLKNLIYPLRAEITNEDNGLIIKAPGAKEKGLLIGRNQSNIKNNLKIIQKYFKEINYIKVQ